MVPKGTGFVNLHCICFFLSASPFLHPAFLGLISSDLVETEIPEMLSSQKFME